MEHSFCFYARVCSKPRHYDAHASFVCLCLRGAQTFALIYLNPSFYLMKKQRNTTTAIHFPLCACFIALAPFFNSTLELRFFYTAGCLLSTRCLLLCEELEHEASKLKEIMCSDYN
jgi:hypothetical protein